MLDVLIMGAGPIGLACGIEAQKRHLTYLIVEKGCLVNSLYHYPRNMTFFSTSERLEIGNVPFISHSDKPTRREALDYYRRVASVWKLNLKLYESVEKIDKKDVYFEILTPKGVYQARNIVLATGFYDLPNLMGVAGEDLPKVKHYYDEPHGYAFQKIAVVGAANSAVDAALETYRKSAEVTMVIRENEIRPSVKYWVRPDIENRIKEGSIKAFFNAQIAEIREYEIDIQTLSEKITIPNDFVLAMTGYQPNYHFLENLGVEISSDSAKRPLYDSKTQETSQKGVYVAGVVCGGMKTNEWFIENSRIHADLIMDHIRQKA